VFGGIVGFWTEESAQLTESQPSIAKISLDAKKLTAFTLLTNELLADARAASAIVNRTFPDALRFFEDTSFLNGTGVGEPLGMMNGGATISVSRTTATKIRWPDVTRMFARMLPDSLERAVWVASPRDGPLRRVAE
jgi:HK97 family phage major capsid protein